jgi:hypothetical protein
MRVLPLCVVWSVFISVTAQPGICEGPDCIYNKEHTLAPSSQPTTAPTGRPTTKSPCSPGQTYEGECSLDPIFACRYTLSFAPKICVIPKTDLRLALIVILESLVMVAGAGARCAL